MDIHEFVTKLIEKLEVQRNDINKRIYRLEKIQFKLSEHNGYDLTEQDWLYLLDINEDDIEW